MKMKSVNKIIWSIFCLPTLLLAGYFLVNDSSAWAIKVSEELTSKVATPSVPPHIITTMSGLTHLMNEHLESLTFETIQDPRQLAASLQNDFSGRSADHLLAAYLLPHILIAPGNEYQGDKQIHVPPGFQALKETFQQKDANSFISPKFQRALSHYETSSDLKLKLRKESRALNLVADTIFGHNFTEALNAIFDQSDSDEKPQIAMALPSIIHFQPKFITPRSTTQPEDHNPVPPTFEQAISSLFKSHKISLPQKGHKWTLADIGKLKKLEPRAIIENLKHLLAVEAILSSDQAISIDPIEMSETLGSRRINFIIHGHSERALIVIYTNPSEIKADRIYFQIQTATYQFKDLVVYFDPKWTRNQRISLKDSMQIQAHQAGMSMDDIRFTPIPWP